MSDKDAGEPPAKFERSPAPVLELINGMAARREVERWLLVDREAAEQWLREKVWLGYVETWYDPWFLCLPKVAITAEFLGLSAWTFDGLFPNMWEFELKLVCITRGSLERALTIGKSRGPEDDLWEEIRLDIELRSGFTEWRFSRFENRRVEDLLQEPLPVEIIKPLTPSTSSFREAVRGDIDQRARGITRVDGEHDERLKQALQEPMRANDKRFKTAVYEVHKASGMPLEFAEEALIEAVETGKVEAWKPFGLARSRQTLRHLRSPVDPDTRINGEQLSSWIKWTYCSRKHVGQPSDPGPPPKECVPFHVARAMVGKVSGYDKEAACSWLVDAILVNKRIPAWRKPSAEYPGWRVSSSGDHPGDLYVMTEVFRQAVAVEFDVAEAISPVSPEADPGRRGDSRRRSKPRGRTPLEYWPEVLAKAHKWLFDEGGESEHGAQARVVKHLAELITKQGYAEPAPSTLKKYANDVIASVVADKGR